IEDLLRIVNLAAGIHDGERALSEQLVQAAGPRIEQFIDLGLRQVFEAALRSDPRIHEVGNDDAGFQESLDQAALVLVSPSVPDARRPEGGSRCVNCAYFCNFSVCRRSKLSEADRWP